MSFNKADLFDTQDLFEGKNMVKVLNNVEQLSQRARKKGFAGIAGLDQDGGAAAADYPASPVRAAPVQAAPPASPAQADAPSGGNCADCGAPRPDGASHCADCGAAFA